MVMKTLTRVQNLDKAVYNSHITNNLEESMNQIILLSAMGK